jgi:Zn-dependent protease
MEPSPPRPTAPPPYRAPEPLPPLRYAPEKRPGDSTWKKILSPIAVVGLLLLSWGGKLKFILLPLLKFFPMLLKTGGSMILSVGAYALLYGWKFAVGLVLLIFVHELGHLVAARMVGLKVGWPVFIPFMGAIIALKEAPKNAWIEAIVGIGGPILGSVGALACYGLYGVTGHPLFLALTYVGCFLNLFNLAPIGFLDGGRIATAISPWLWVVGTAIVVAMIFVSFNPLLLLILIFSLPRFFSLFRKQTDEEKRYFETTPERRAIMAVLYFGLAALLAVAMKMIHGPTAL